MKKSLIFIAFITFFVGCSTSTPPNQWQYKSTTAFNSYKENFLKQNLVVAQADLKRSIKHAKMSADLTQLATIYLSECALKTAVSTSIQRCDNYKKIQPLVQNRSLDAYFNFLQKEETNVELLPSEYRKSLFNIAKPTSFFVKASLMQESLTELEMNKVLNKASLYGYKQVVFFWLKKISKITKNSIKRKNIMMKILILSSQDCK